MGDRGVPLMHPGEFGLREPDAMAEHGAPADQTVMVIDVEEVLPLRKKLGDEGDLVAVLGDVGLHIQLRMLAPQRARCLKLGLNARSRPARGDGVEQAPSPMPFARADDTHQKQSFKELIEQGYKVKAIENAALGGSQDQTVVTMQMEGVGISERFGSRRPQKL